MILGQELQPELKNTRLKVENHIGGHLTVTIHVRYRPIMELDIFLLKLTFNYNKIQWKYRIQYTKHCFIAKASIYFVTWGKPIIRVNSSSD